MSHYFSTISKFIQNVKEVGEDVTLWVDVRSSGIHICFCSDFSIEEEPPENKILIESEDGETWIKIDSDAEIVDIGANRELLSYIIKDSNLDYVRVTINNLFTEGANDIQSLTPDDMQEEIIKNNMII